MRKQTVPSWRVPVWTAGQQFWLAGVVIMATDSWARGFQLQLPGLPAGQATRASGHGRLINKYTLAKKIQNQELKAAFHNFCTSFFNWRWRRRRFESTPCEGVAVSTWRQAGPFPLLAVLGGVFQRGTLWAQWPAGAVKLEWVVVGRRIEGQSVKSWKTQTHRASLPSRKWRSRMN